MDISPSQMVSISAALIPFLEHDDANRALMGSNMQRQAVPLLRSERPLVGTGMEVDVARDSGACILAESSGVVHYADANRIIVAYDDPALYPNMGGVRAYDLLKFHKSNQNSCFGQVPSCVPGQIVKKGDVLLILEAMKMETAITARTAGTVKTVRVKEGQPVKAKELLMVLE